MATWAQFGLQDAASPVMEEFIFFHDFTIVVLAFITGLVGVIMRGLLVRRCVNKGIIEGQLLERI